MNALLFSAILGVVMMFTGIWIKKPGTVKAIAIAGAALLFVVNWMERSGIRFLNYDTSAFLSFSSFSLVFIAIMVVALLLFFMVSGDEMQKIGTSYADYFALLFFITSGVVLLASFNNLLILFLGIEIITIPSFILAGAEKKNLKSNEASLKYFFLGAFSTGVMLMGIALLYGAQGTFDISKMNFATHISSKLQIAGMLFLLFSMSFKASVVPFHFWAPDVYDGAPTAFTSFMATIIKSAVFIGFLKLFANTFGDLQPVWQLWIVLLIAATLFVSNITAVFQQSVKRMLAYSSISHAGFMLFAIYAVNETANEGLILYVAAYCLATIGIFAVLDTLKDHSYEGFNGLARHHPTLALVGAICLLSLAGIPLSAGFLAKFYMLKAAVLTGKHLWLVIFAVLMAAVSAYYYFRVIQAMYFKEGPRQQLQLHATEKYAFIAIAVLIIVLGIFPGVLLNYLYF